VSDIALRWNGEAADFAIEGNDLATDDGLRTAVLLSLFTDRRAEEGDVLPDAETDRRGWWADAFPVVDGDKMGSRLWLLARAKQSQDVVDRAREYAREALAWLVEDKVASQVEVTSEVPSPGVLAIGVVVHRPNLDPVKFRFDDVWSALERE
jgi:phage gp46-like protein